MGIDDSMWHAWAIFPVGVKFCITTHHISEEEFKDTHTTWLHKFVGKNGDFYGTPTLMNGRKMKRVTISLDTSDYKLAKKETWSTTNPDPAHCCSICCVPNAKDTFQPAYDYVFELIRESTVTGTNVIASKGRKKNGSCRKCVVQFLSVASAHHSLPCYCFEEKVRADTVPHEAYLAMLETALRALHDRVPHSNKNATIDWNRARQPHSHASFIQHNNIATRKACGHKTISA